METFIQTAISGLVVGAIYGMVAIGFTIVFNATRVINFAHGEFVMMGGLIAAAAVTTYKVPAIVAVPAAVAIVTVAGIGLEKLALQQARHKSHLTLVMITIGVGIAFRGLMSVAIGKGVYFMPEFGILPTVVAGDVFVPSQGMWNLLSLLVLSGLLWLLYSRTLIGKAMRAASENGRAAMLCGIDPAIMSVLAYALAAATGALAGVLIAPMASANYQNGIFLGLKGFAAAILGGIGNPLGAIIGGLLIGLMEALSAGYIDSSYKDAVAFLVLLILLILRPGGLLGTVEVKRV